MFVRVYTQFRLVLIRAQVQFTYLRLSVNTVNTAALIVIIQIYRKRVVEDREIRAENVIDDQKIKIKKPIDSLFIYLLI